jgi:hypothetical protein
VWVVDPGAQVHVASLRRLIGKLRQSLSQAADHWDEADAGLAWLNLRRATETALQALEASTPTQGSTTEARALQVLRERAGLVGSRTSLRQMRGRAHGAASAAQSSSSAPGQ